MIRIALTKGRIEKSALEILKTCGYDVGELEAKGRKLIFRTGNLEIVLAKAADVITYIDRGVCDVGFVGSDTINEHGGNFYEMLDLGFGVCRFALAGLRGQDFYSGYQHKVVATKYPVVARKYFSEKGVDCEIVRIDGSVELAPLLGLADAIVDIVETGATCARTVWRSTRTSCPCRRAASSTPFPSSSRTRRSGNSWRRVEEAKA